MKKILLATTLIAASTGYAAAEVAVSGSARMGVVMNNDALGNSTDLQFSSRVRVKFTMTGETDGGLTFGAEVRNDQAGNGNTKNGDSTVYLSGAFGKVTMGDTGNAADALVGQVSGVGYTGLTDLNEIGFLGRDNTGVYYEYAAGAITFGIGAGQTVSNDTVVLPALASDNDDFISAAVKYSTDAYTVALGYEKNNTDKQISLLGSATFSGATLKLKLADRDTLSDMMYALSVDYAISGATVTAFYTDQQAINTYGIGASYDLGGGASVSGGIARSTGADTIAELGITMSF